MLGAITWDVDPILIHIGDRGIRWYGLLWAIGIYIAYRIQVKLYKNENCPPEWIDKLFIWMVIGLIIGARVGHCWFYEWYKTADPIQIPLDKNPMPGHLSELHPVNEVNTKGQSFRASFGKNPRFQIQLDKRPLSPGTSREASGVPCLNPRRGLTLLSPVCRDPAIGV